MAAHAPAPPPRAPRAGRSDRRDEGEGLAAHGLCQQRHPAAHLGERAQLERRLGQPAAAARLLRLELRCEHLVEVGLRVRVGVRVGVEGLGSGLGLELA